MTYKSYLRFQSRRDKNRAAEEPAAVAGFEGASE
jgi:hypothetical protein